MHVVSRVRMIYNDRKLYFYYTYYTYKIVSFLLDSFFMTNLQTHALTVNTGDSVPPCFFLKRQKCFQRMTYKHLVPGHCPFPFSNVMTGQLVYIAVSSSPWTLDIFPL